MDDKELAKKIFGAYRSQGKPGQSFEEFKKEWLEKHKTTQAFHKEDLKDKSTEFIKPDGKKVSGNKKTSPQLHTIKKSLGLINETALEEVDEKHVEEVLNMEVPIDFENAFNDNPIVEGVHANSAHDGLMLSLLYLQKVDIEYISKITDLSMQDIINELKGVIYQDPLLWEQTFYKGWVTKDEYLTDNLREKYKAASEANKIYTGLFDQNLKLLDSIAANTPQIKSDDIYITFGSPWIPLEMVEEFIQNLYFDSSLKIKHDTYTGSWSIETTPYVRKSFDNIVKYGTRRRPGLEIIERCLNQGDIVVFDDVGTGKKKELVRNDKETALAIDKRNFLMEKFRSWMFDDPLRKAKLTEIYNQRFCNNHIRIFDGSKLEMPDKNEELILRDYQKNAIMRIILSDNTLLAHDVGSGKSFEMIGAAHELYRLKVSKKNLIVVPNNILLQWEDMYKYMYPEAKILLVNPNKNFAPSKREDTLKDIRDNDYEAIIMPYSSFDMIPFSKSFIKKEIEDKERALEEAYNNPKTCTQHVKTLFTHMVKDKSKRLEDDLLYGKSEEELLDSICLDELHIDRLFLDECHNYKNVTIDTNVHALGLSSASSKKCDHMMSFVNHIQNEHDGKGVVFASGTPITNSITDCFNLQKYLQNGLLKVLGLDTFNSWIANFGEKQEGFEIDVDAVNYRMASRYRKFHNLPELASILARVADFHHVSKEDENMPTYNGPEDIVIPSNDQFEEFLKDISKRLELIRQKRPTVFVRKTPIIRNNEIINDLRDNTLLITTQGRLGALDLRLIDPKIKVGINTKGYACASKVAKIYHETEPFKGTQLIFCDSSTPKDEFNMYDELKTILINDFAIPEEQIVFIHDADSDSKKNQLAIKVNAGDIRIVIGSTSKLGQGINYQTKLYAIHHLDVPWKPNEMVQRLGRIYRSGNQNELIHVYRYVMEKSFDSYSWQLLETKEDFISKLLTNCVMERSGEDISDSALSYSEIKLLAIGDPLIKERIKITNELARLRNLQLKTTEVLENNKVTLIQYETRKKYLENYILLAKEDQSYLNGVDLELQTSDRDIELRKIFNSEVYNKLVESVNTQQELSITNYLGFDLFGAKVSLSQNNEYTLILKRSGTYKIKIEKESGITIRIHNFLKGLAKDILDKSSELNMIDSTISGLNEAINQSKSYNSDIADLEAQLLLLDIKLNINK